MNGRGRLVRVGAGLLIVALLVTAFPVLGPPAQAQAGTAVFINEIHYDNAGTDTGEAIEVAGPADTDLSGWSLVSYNGNGGAVYKTVALSGLIPLCLGGRCSQYARRCEWRPVLLRRWA